MKTFRLIAAGIAAGLLTAGTAGAASVSYILDSSDRLPAGQPYVEVTISDGADGAIDFVVKTLDALNDVAGNKFGIQRFALNVNGPATAWDVTGLPEKWKVQDGQRVSGFGFFDIVLRGPGNHRTDELRFSIDGVDGDTPLDYALKSVGKARFGNSLFAARLGDFDFIDGNHRIRNATASVVPLPASAWLLASGLGLAALLRRRSPR